jgi:molybdopterin-binding protein
MLKIAKEYVARGWSVIPVHGNKRPAISWKEFQSRRASDGELEKWFVGTEYGIGVICGEISGLLVFDVEKVGLGTYDFDTLTVGTQSGGKHFYFKWQVGQYKHNYDLNGVHLADLRGNGQYVLAPPTRGVWGSYRWLNDKPVGRFREIRVNPYTNLCSSVEAKPGSRSEKLQSIAYRVIVNGGDESDVHREMMAHPAGSKLSEKRDPLAYVRLCCEKARNAAPSAIHGCKVSLSVLSVSHGKDRTTAVMKADDGRIVRHGVTGIVKDASGKIVNLEVGKKIVAIIKEVNFNNMKIWQVASWVST